MNLSKTQIQFIDSYLKEQGVKFWDVRIELIDHIASKLEGNKSLTLSRTFLIKEFGTKITLGNLVDKKQKTINKKYRKLYFKEIVNFFRDVKKIAVFGILLFLYFLLFKHLPYKSFKIISTILFVFPMIVYIIVALKNHYNKEKSIHLERALFYVAFSFLILQMFVRYSNVEELTLLILIPLNSFLSYCGYVVYKKTHKEYSKIYKELKSI